MSGRHSLSTYNRNMLIKILLLIAPLIIYGTGYLLLNAYDFFGICFGELNILDNKKVCWSDLASIAISLKFAGQYLFLTAALLFFATKKTFSLWWWRFAIWFIPLALILIALQPDIGITFELLQPGKTVFTTWLGTLFLIVSALIIFFSNRKK